MEVGRALPIPMRMRSEPGHRFQLHPNRLERGQRHTGRGATPSGAGGLGGACVLAAVGEDIVASVSGDWQKSEDREGIKIDHRRRKLKSYSEDVCLRFDSLKLE